VSDRAPQLTVLSEHSSIPAADGSATFVALIDPPPAVDKRPPLRLALALDVSGSMQGEPLATAVLSARGLVRCLGADDTFACVGFSDRVEILVAAQQMTAAGKARAEERLLRAQADGSTDLAGAMLKALEIVNQEPIGGRVLLLTDGQPTAGVTRPAQIEVLARGALGRATLSTFGFGRGVNARLLASLAEIGRGGYTFIETGEPPVEAIGAELGGLLATVATGVELRIVCTPGVEVREVHRSSGVTVGDGDVTIALPSLVAEEPAAVVFTLAWTPESAGEILATVELASRSPESGELSRRAVPCRPTVTLARGAIDPKAAREIAIARAAAALAQASDDVTGRRPDARDRLSAAAAALGEYARVAGVDQDSGVRAALGMVSHTLAELGRAVSPEVQQNMVAAAVAVRHMRGTMIGFAPGAMRELTRNYQTRGSELLRASLPPPEAPGVSEVRPIPPGPPPPSNLPPSNLPPNNLPPKPDPPKPDSNGSKS
jgi:Ca-activated chloride channel family protein